MNMKEAMRLTLAELRKSATVLREALDKVEKEWNALARLQKEIEAPTDDEDDIDEETARRIYDELSMQVKKSNAKVKAKKSSFKVVFSDGRVISAPKAKDVFAQTIEAIGPERVVNCKEKLSKEPLVTRNRSEITKYPKSIVEIKGGWFVVTHCSTKMKIKYLKQIASLLNIDLEIK